MRFYSYLFKAVIFFLASIAFTGTTLARAPSWQWARAGVAQARAIVNDDKGNLYVAGYVDKHLVLEGDTIPGDGGIFVAKYAAGGNLLWAKRYGIEFLSSLHGVNLDKHNNIYLAGAFYYEEVIGNDSVRAIGSRDMLLIKLDPEGNPIWARGAGSDDNEYMYSGVGVDAEGSVYISGESRGDTMYFGNVKLPAGALGCVFVAKYDTDGNFVWARTYDGPGQDGALGVAADAAGNVYTTGFCSGNISFGNTVFADAAGFVAKHDKNGNLLWARPVHNSTCIAVTADDAGSAYVTGACSDTFVFGNTTLIGPAAGGNTFIAKYDKDGIAQWAQILSDSVDDSGHGLSVTTDRSNAVYVGGAMDQRGFLAKLGADGKMNWMKKSIPATGSVEGICVDKTGGVSVVCDYRGFKSGFDSLLPALPYYFSMAVAKLTRFPTSVEQGAVLSSNIQLYPNPAATTVTINSAEPYDAITIVDVLGRVVLDQTLTSYQKESVIDVSSLSPGVYVLQLKGRTKTQVRFVKE